MYLQYEVLFKREQKKKKEISTTFGWDGGAIRLIDVKQANEKKEW